MGAGPVASIVEDAPAVVSWIFDEAERHDPGLRRALYTPRAPCLWGARPPERCGCSSSQETSGGLLRILVAGADVRIVTEDGELIRALTRSCQPIGGRWPVRNVLQQVSTVS